MSNTTKRFLMAAAGAGGAETKYIENNFSTQLYKGTGAAQSIVSGVDLSTDGGLVISKNRTDTEDWVWGSTAPSLGTGRWIPSNSINQRQNNVQSYTAFNDDGYSIGTFSSLNQNGGDIVSYSFRKAPGFLDIVEYVGDDSSSRNISHNLGSTPGWIVTMCTTKGENKTSWHKSLTSPKWIILDSTGSPQSGTPGGNVAYPQMPTSTQFTIGNYNNIAGETYVAYLWAGGESTAATARSVNFTGTGNNSGSQPNLSLASSSDFAYGTGDFTIEAWLKPANSAADQVFFDHGVDNPMLGILNGKWQYYNSTTSHKYAGTPCRGDWTHFAVSRQSGTTRFFINGQQRNSFSDTHNYGAQAASIGSYNTGTYGWNGGISNVRVVKGTAVYTSSFKPSTEPLTNITNTKLLCCNDSSPTGSTVTPGTITNNNSVTASTDSPFDDPNGFLFGENEDQNLIKTGSYIGNGSSTGPEVYIGWEPQWIIIRNGTSSGNGWMIYDTMRGWFDNANASGNDRYMMINSTNAETTFDNGHPTSTGFALTTSNPAFNANGDTYIYIAIRRSDPLVGKPAKVGTDVFDIKPAQTGGSTPFYQGYGFVVDSIINKKPDATNDFFTYQRLVGQLKLKINESTATSNSSNALWDYMNGFNAYTGNDGYVLGWGWKRCAGFDVVCFKGVQNGRLFRHNLGRVPEMMWFKCRTADQDWQVYHKGLNGGVNPEQWNIVLGSNYSPYGAGAENNSTVVWNNTAPTAETFSSGGFNSTGHHTGEWYLVQLFASVDGISKVGYYTGNGNNGHEITTGFSPRFVIIRRTDGTEDNWVVLDTTRGWGSGDDKVLKLNSDAAQGTSDDFGAPTSSGFSLTSDGWVNYNTGNFIYYAHA